MKVKILKLFITGAVSYMVLAGFGSFCFAMENKKTDISKDFLLNRKTKRLKNETSKIKIARAQENIRKVLASKYEFFSEKKLRCFLKKRGFDKNTIDQAIENYTKECGFEFAEELWTEQAYKLIKSGECENDLGRNFSKMSKQDMIKSLTESKYDEGSLYSYEFTIDQANNAIDRLIDEVVGVDNEEDFWVDQACNFIEELVYTKYDVYSYNVYSKQKLIKDLTEDKLYTEDQAHGAIQIVVNKYIASGKVKNEDEFWGNWAGEAEKFINGDVDLKDTEKAVEVLVEDEDFSEEDALKAVEYLQRKKVKK